MTTLARRMWEATEPIHAVCYFAPAAAEAVATSGTRGFWMGYVAARAAPMGPVGPAVVEAAFAGFAPSVIRRALPDAWSFTTPQRVLDAQLEGMGTVLRGLVDVDGPDVVEAATLAREAAAVAAADTLGRPLGAAHGALPWPDAPHLQLWRACTVLREHRGDGHVAALVGAGVDGPLAHLTAAATNGVDPELLRRIRGFGEDVWAAARDRGVEQGWLTTDGTLTDPGRQVRERVEADTDAAATAPWEHLGAHGCDRLVELTAPLRDAIAATGWFPDPNPIGVPLR